MRCGKGKKCDGSKKSDVRKEIRRLAVGWIEAVCFKLVLVFAPQSQTTLDSKDLLETIECRNPSYTHAQELCVGARVKAPYLRVQHSVAPVVWRRRHSASVKLLGDSYIQQSYFAKTPSLQCTRVDAGSRQSFLQKLLEGALATRSPSYIPWIWWLLQGFLQYSCAWFPTSLRCHFLRLIFVNFRENVVL